MYRVFRPSGGLRYHWRAWRQRRAWAGFRKEIETWLEEWAPETDELILIGPSGGYTLPTEWLRKFKTIYAFDADPLAKVFFRREHPGVNVRFERRDLFWDEGRFSAQSLQNVMKAHPNAAVLLSNVLGQLLLEHNVSEEAWEHFLAELRGRLERKSWASYHDLYTHEKGEVIDHLLDGKWKAGLETRQFRWPLTKASQHLIEGVRSNP
jgi:hypothetical protein